MKKLFLIIAMMFAYGFSAYAYYEENYPITITQPDGTKVECFVTGDEFYRWGHDAAGYTLIRDEQTGFVVYAKLENDKLVSTGYRVGSIDPATVGLTPYINISAEKRMQMRSEFLEKTPQKPVREGYQASRGGWNNGTLNNLVIYIRFAGETEFPAKAGVYVDMHNKDVAGYSSQYGYFKALSNEKTLIPSTFYPLSSGDVILSYQDIYPRCFFEPYDATANPDGYQGGDNEWERTEREHQLLARTVEAVKHQIPTDLDLDFNDDGFVDNICFIVRGDTGDWASLLWPHRWALYSEYVFINGKMVWDFNLQIETHLDVVGASVLSHEMFHTLGSPDLYRYHDKTIDPVGSWSLMCANTTPPQSTMVYMKYKYGGWIETIPEITERGTYTLNNAWSKDNNAYKIASPNSSTEFFVVEYRDKNVYWDSGLPGSGLIIYRINTDYEGNAFGPPDEVYIFRPDGTNTLTNGDIYAAHFSSGTGRTVFNNSTNPPCFLSNDKPGGIHIRNIGTAGETISFEVVMPALTVDVTELDFDKVKVGKTSPTQTVTISGEDLTGNITWSKGGVDAAAFSVTEKSWNPATGGALDVTFSPTASKSYNATITVKSANATTKTIALKGKGMIPSLTVTPTELNFNDVDTGTTSPPQTITISGTDLTEKITYEKGGDDTATFDIDETAWDPATGGTLIITFSPSATKTYNATITVSNAETEDKTVALTGNGVIVAINELDAINNITIYPNPTDGQLIIEMGDMGYEICDIAIFDMMGRKVSHLTISQPISISHLPAGIYFICIQTENEVIMRKMVKQ